MPSTGPMNTETSGTDIRKAWQAPPKYAPKRPGAWRRWLSGTIATALWLVGLFFLLWAIHEDANCGPNEWFCGDGYLTITTFLFIVLPIWIMTAPFALATFLPFGTVRRVLLGIGGGMLSGLGVLAGVVGLELLVSVEDVRPVEVILALVAGGAAVLLTGFYAYRLAR